MNQNMYLYGDKFNRWEYPGATLSFSRFRKYHSDINNLYWSFKSSIPPTFKATRGHKFEDKMHEVFNIDPIDYGRRIIPLKEWRDNFTDFQNWTRVGVLMSLVSNFETYIHSISSLAIESKPGILLQSPNAIDGVILLKRRKEYSFVDETIDIVKGEWSSRISFLNNLFGSHPPIFSQNISELEKIRNLRNNFGHSFGRNVSINKLILNVDYFEAERLSEERLIKWMKIFYEISLAMDIWIGKKFIGNYELIKIFHAVYKSLPEKAQNGHPNTMVKPFTKHLGKFRVNWNHRMDKESKKFVRELIAYYFSIT